MTITDTIAPPLERRDLGALTDEALAEAWGTADVDDPAVFAAFLAEFDQRAAAERMSAAHAAREAILAEGYDAAYAQYLKASEYTRGTLLSELGSKRVTDEMSLWTGSEAAAMRYASEELRDFWMFVEPRMSPGRYARQRGEHMRIEREAARDEREASNGLARDEARPLRRGETAAEAPEAGPGGAVDRGRPAAGHGASGDGQRDRRAAGPVQRDGLEGADMGVIHAARVVAREVERSQRAAAARAETPTAPERDPLAETLAAEIGGPGRIVPGEQQDEGDFIPGDLKFVLDETAEFVAKHVACTPAQSDVMTLYAAATHALKAFPTFGRMLFAGETEACGKTVAMTVTAALAANPLDASGTPYALQSALAAASNAPEQLTPTLYYDEISGVFGRSGLASSRDPIAEILRKGYKQGATRAWSVNRTSEQYSIYTPFLMAGLRNAVPRDIRTRCIVVIMRAGTPGAYFDTREAEPEASALAACLGQAAASRITEIAAFRARGIHPKLRDRHLEVWEGLFAVAYVLGGQEWLNRCLAAFRELALADAAQVTLSPRQQVLRDAAQVLEEHLADMAATGFVGGLALADEMRRMDNPLYAARSEASMAKLISEAMPVATKQKRVLGKPVRGYFTCEIVQAWEAVRPAGMEDASIPEEENPFAVTDEAGDDDEDPRLTSDVADVTAVTGIDTD